MSVCTNVSWNNVAKFASKHNTRLIIRMQQREKNGHEATRRKNPAEYGQYTSLAAVSAKKDAESDVRRTGKMIITDTIEICNGKLISAMMYFIPITDSGTSVAPLLSAHMLSDEMEMNASILGANNVKWQCAIKNAEILRRCTRLHIGVGAPAARTCAKRYVKHTSAVRRGTAFDSTEAFNNAASAINLENRVRWADAACMDKYNTIG